MISSEQESFEFSIDSSAGLVSSRTTGALTFGKIVNYVSSLKADPKFNPDFSELVDLRAVESVRLSAREAMMLADQVDPFSPLSRRGFVALSETQAHAAQLHLLLRPGSDTVRIFFSMEEAQRWLKSEEGSSPTAGT